MASKKRISFSVINDTTYDQRMHKICGSLAKAGYDVTLIGRVLPNSLPISNHPFTVKRLKCYVNKGKLFYLEYNIRLLFYLLTHNFDALSAVDCDTLWANYIASRLKRKKLAFDAHELFSEVPEVIRRPKVQRIWKYTEKVIIPKTDIRYTVGAKIGEYYEELYGAKFDVIMNAPSLQNYEPPPVELNEPFILYQGALNEGRGLEILLEAMQQLNTKLVLIGEGDLSSALRNMVKDFNIEDKVIFKGYLMPDKMKPYTYAAKIGINMSENKGLSYYLSLNNKFFDYIHAGLPAVTNDFPEYRELNQTYNVVKLANTDLDSLVNNIKALLENEEYYNKLKENCKLASLELNWNKEEEKLLAIYASI